MGFTQKKDIIIYKGTKYGFTYNLTTRQADGDIDRLSKTTECIEKNLVMFFMEFPDADGIYEAILKRSEISYCVWTLHELYNQLQPYLEEIKKNMKKIIRTKRRLDCASDWIHALFAIDLTDLEIELYYASEIRDKQILKKYAYQYSKYCNYIQMPSKVQEKITQIIEADGKIEMPSSIMDFFLKVDQRYNEIKNMLLNNAMQEYYEKNKKYEFTDGKYNYIVPSTVEQVKNEASQQHNCLYDLYLSRMTSDSYSNVIICVRDINNPTESLYTIEYIPSEKRFKQCYRKHNCVVDSKIKNYLLTQIVGHE